MHGIIMVFFFLIPAVPAVLGNFLLPMMIGAKDLAFPRLNLLSWYLYIIGAVFTLWAVLGRRGYRMDVLYPFQQRTPRNTNVMLASLGIFITGSVRS